MYCSSRGYIGFTFCPAKLNDIMLDFMELNFQIFRFCQIFPLVHVLEADLLGCLHFLGALLCVAIFM